MHIYAIVVHDPRQRGFDKVAMDAGNVLVGRGYEALWQSSTLLGDRVDVEDPDFDLRLFSHGRELEAVPAGNTEEQSTPELVAQATEILRVLYNRHGECRIGDTAEAIDRTCEAWDSFERAVNPLNADEEMGDDVEQAPAGDPQQYQRWSLGIPAGRHKGHISTNEQRLDVYVANLYPEEALMRALVDRAGVDAFMEYADPPADVTKSDG